MPTALQIDTNGETKISYERLVAALDPIEKWNVRGGKHENCNVGA